MIAFRGKHRRRKFRAIVAASTGCTSSSTVAIGPVARCTLWCLAVNLSLLPLADVSGAILLRDGFESANGYTPGEFTESGNAVVVSGRASISEEESGEGSQSLRLHRSEPVTEVEFSADLGDLPGLCLELKVRPATGDSFNPVEFLDFGGARIGFFGNGEKGEIFVEDSDSLYNSHWMETGRLFSVDGSGLSREWIDIEVKKAVDGVSWDLSVNGEEAALGVGGVKYDGEPVPSLYFIGDERADTFFDELAVSEAETEGVAAPVFGGSLNSVIAVGPGVGSGADRGGGEVVSRWSGESVLVPGPNRDMIRVWKGRSDYRANPGRVGRWVTPFRSKSPRGGLGKVLFVDNRMGSDGLNGCAKRRSGYFGPKRTLGAALSEVENGDVIRIETSEEPYIYEETGSRDGVVFLQAVGEGRVILRAPGYVARTPPEPPDLRPPRRPR